MATSVGELVAQFVEIDVIRGALKPFALWIGGETDTGFAIEDHVANRIALYSEFPTALSVVGRARFHAAFIDDERRQLSRNAGTAEPRESRRQARHIYQWLRMWKEQNDAIQKICNDYFAGDIPNLDAALFARLEGESNYNGLLAEVETELSAGQHYERARRQYEERHIRHELEFAAQIQKRLDSFATLPSEPTFPLPSLDESARR